MRKGKGKVVTVTCSKSMKFFDGLYILAGDIVRIDEKSFQIINHISGDVIFRETEPGKVFIYAAALLEVIKKNK